MSVERPPSVAMVPPNKKFIFKAEVLERLGGISSVCLLRWVKEGAFPPPVEVGGRAAWIEADVNRWMNTRPPTRSLRPYKKAKSVS